MTLPSMLEKPEAMKEVECLSLGSDFLSALAAANVIFFVLPVTNLVGDRRLLVKPKYALGPHGPKTVGI